MGWPGPVHQEQTFHIGLEFICSEDKQNHHPRHWDPALDPATIIIRIERVNLFHDASLYKLTTCNQPPLYPLPRLGSHRTNEARTHCPLNRERKQGAHCPYRDGGFAAPCGCQCAVGDRFFGQLWTSIRLGLYAAFGWAVIHFILFYRDLLTVPKTKTPRTHVILRGQDCQLF